MEESKYKDAGRLKLDNYIIFELIRQTRDGGGLALGCAKELQPVWLREGNNSVETMSVKYDAVLHTATKKMTALLRRRNFGNT